MDSKDRDEVMRLIETRAIPEPNSGCWLWEAGCDPAGYGGVKWKGVKVRAHRLSFHAFYNRDPGPLSVMHSCDISSCVNPNHLSLGTTGENIREAAAKGRIGRGRQSWRVARGGRSTRIRVSIDTSRPPAELVRSVLSYNPDTGIFFWRDRPDDIGWTRKNAGKPAGWVSAHGKRGRIVNYVRIAILKRPYYAHRLAWLYVHGDWPASHEIDHINGDTLDNRIANLRRATHAQNGHNTGLRRNNTSGVKGVTWDKRAGKWVAQISVNHKNIFLGHFTSVGDAAVVRKAAELRYHADFAHQGTA